MITDKPCLAQLREGSWAVVEQIYPAQERPLLGRTLNSFPSVKNGFRLDYGAYQTWLPSGAVVSCNEHHYDIVGITPLPYEAIAERFEDLLDQLKMAKKRESLLRGHYDQLRDLAGAIVTNFSSVESSTVARLAEFLDKHI